MAFLPNGAVDELKLEQGKIAFADLGDKRNDPGWPFGPKVSATYRKLGELIGR